MVSLIKMPSPIFETISFFDYVGMVELGEKLYLKNKKFYRWYHFYTRLCRKLRKETLTKQFTIFYSYIERYELMIINYETNIYTQNLTCSLRRFLKGIETLKKTYNERQVMFDELIHRIKRILNI